MSSFAKAYHVYIVSNVSKMLYTGVTGDLESVTLQEWAANCYDSGVPFVLRGS